MSKHGRKQHIPSRPPQPATPSAPPTDPFKMREAYAAKFNKLNDDNNRIRQNITALENQHRSNELLLHQLKGGLDAITALMEGAPTPTPSIPAPTPPTTDSLPHREPVTTEAPDDSESEDPSEPPAQPPPPPAPPTA